MRDYQNLSACTRNRILLILEVDGPFHNDELSFDLHNVCSLMPFLASKNRDPVWAYPLPLSELCLIDSFSTAFQRRAHKFLGSLE